MREVLFVSLSVPPSLKKIIIDVLPDLEGDHSNQNLNAVSSIDHSHSCFLQVPSQPHTH